jgi:hypothetical protein
MFARNSMFHTDTRSKLKVLNEEFAIESLADANE